MEHSIQEQPRRNSVTVVRWTKKPSQNPWAKFFLFSVFGLLLCLALMMVLPVLRSFGAVVLFTTSFAMILTAPTLSSERGFTQGLVKRVNDTVLEVTGNPGNQLSVRQFRHLVESGEQLFLPVSGVTGLNLHVERAPVVAKSAPEKFSAVFTVVPPENGTASFDRLLAAALRPRLTP